MRKIILSALLVLLAAVISRAQETPRAEVSASYSFLRFGLSSGVNQNGASVSIAGNVNHWLGIVGDVGGYHAAPYGNGINTYTYLVGPRVSYRNSGRVTPFAQVLLGGAHNSLSSGGPGSTANSFAFSAGGGVDIGLSRRIAVRPQLDYIGLHSQGSTFNSARGSFGIVFRFGN